LFSNQIIAGKNWSMIQDFQYPGGSERTQLILILSPISTDRPKGWAPQDFHLRRAAHEAARDGYQLSVGE
jgi:hypothetical protein